MFMQRKYQNSFLTLVYSGDKRSIEEKRGVCDQSPQEEDSGNNRGEKTQTINHHHKCAASGGLEHQSSFNIL